MSAVKATVRKRQSSPSPLRPLLAELEPRSQWPRTCSGGRPAKQTAFPYPSPIGVPVPAARGPWTCNPPAPDNENRSVAGQAGPRCGIRYLIGGAGQR